MKLSLRVNIAEHILQEILSVVSCDLACLCRLEITEKDLSQTLHENMITLNEKTNNTIRAEVEINHCGKTLDEI
jgi:hypothetical protein